MEIGGRQFEECLMRDGCGKGNGGDDIEEISVHIEGLNPISGWHMSMEEKGANHVIYNTYDSFGLSTL